MIINRDSAGFDIRFPLRESLKIKQLRESWLLFLWGLAGEKGAKMGDFEGLLYPFVVPKSEG